MLNDSRQGAARGKGLGLLGFLLASTATAAYLHLRLSNIPGVDAFYHVRHASLYLRDGLFRSEFPWTACSVMSSYAADLWYGFHLLLIPATLVGGPALQIKVGGVLVLAALMVVFYFAMRGNRASYPFLWPFVVVFAVPVVLFRLLMTRPHVPSIGIAALLMSFVVGGSIWQVGLASLAMTLLHLSFFWVIIVVAGTSLVVKSLTERVFEWPKALAALGGMALGWLLRPNPVGAAKLLYVQVVRLAIERQNDVPLLFGSDLATGSDVMERDPANTFLHFAPFLIMWLGAGAVFVAGLCAPRINLRSRTRTILWSSLALSALFLWMAFSLAWRSADLWIAFGVTFVACVFTSLIKAQNADHFMTRRARTALAASGAVLFAIMVGHAVTAHTREMGRAGEAADRCRPAAEWLREHSRPGDIVFQNHWDLFPELFFWNQKDRYIGGLDPIFQYAYDEGLYWKAHYLYTGRALAWTWGTMSPGDSSPEDTYTVLRRDFNASYMVVVRRHTQDLYRYLRHDPRFVLRLESNGLAVFELRDVAPGTRNP